MPARTGNTYTTPKGVVNTKKKTYTGKGPAPAGTKKVAEPSYTEVPTVTVSNDGAVSTSGFSSQQAARRAQRAQKARSQRVRRIINQTKTKPQKLPTPKPYTAPKIKQERQSIVKAINNAKPVEAPKPPAPTQPAKQPVVKSPQVATAVMSSTPGLGPKVTKQRRQAARTELQKAKKAVARTRTAADLPHLGPAEEKVARKVLRVGKRSGATRKELLAATETGLVESGFKNLGYGDADSSGWRQERAMYYPNPQNVKASAKRFFKESVSDTKGTRGKGMSAGQLAQTIQASAYPERYDERKPEAAAILRAFEKGQADPKAVKRYQAAVKEAKDLGMKVADPKQALGPRPSKQVMTRYKAAEKAASQIEKLKLPYVWGGGHNAGEVQLGSGVDCSGAVSYVLQKMGVKLPGGVVSGEMGSYLKPGPGAVTVFYNPTHTFMKIGNRYFGTSGTNPGGGAGFIDKAVGDSEAASGSYAVGHVSGLGQRVAVKLGVANPSFPGVTFSNGGTTASITSGTTRESPGFSNQPIKPSQKVARIKRKLKDLGVGVSSTKTSQPSTSVLDELERKYGVAA